MAIPRIQFGLCCCALILLLSGCRPSTSGTASPVRDIPSPASSTKDAVSQPIAEAAVKPNDWFEDVTSASGVKGRYHTGRDAGRNAIIETVGGGVGLFDYDLDSRLDIYSVGGGDLDPTSSQPIGIAGTFYRQLASGQFQDSTSVAGLDSRTDYSHGILSCDLDHDGFPDLLLTCFGTCMLWMNQGDGTFRAATEEAGLTGSGWHTAAACADLNGDGNLDLFITCYVDWKPIGHDRASEAVPPDDIPAPQNYAAQADRLFLSLGDGRFEDVSLAAGIRTDGMGMGVIAADLNEDGAADVYVANDVVANHLYWGGTPFPLRESAEVSGVAYNDSGTPEGSMGADVEDVNGDARPDLWVTNFELEDNSLYLNLGDGFFQHATSRMGLGTLGRLHVGFGTGIQDFDGDGWPDLYVLNGHVRYRSLRSPYQQPAVLLRNEGGRRFSNVTTTAGSWFQHPHAARGGAVGDWNNDGAVDLVVSSLDEPLVLLKNRLKITPGLRVKLVGVRSPRDPVGATLRYDFQKRQIVRLVKSGAGYLSQSDSRIMIPMDVSDQHVEIMVHWPSKLREQFRVPAGQSDCVLVEGHGLLFQ